MLLFREVTKSGEISLEQIKRTINSLSILSTLYNQGYQIDIENNYLVNTLEVSSEIYSLLQEKLSSFELLYEYTNLVDLIVKEATRLLYISTSLYQNAIELPYMEKYNCMSNHFNEFLIDLGTSTLPGLKYNTDKFDIRKKLEYRSEALKSVNSFNSKQVGEYLGASNCFEYYKKIAEFCNITNASTYNTKSSNLKSLLSRKNITAPDKITQLIHYYQIEYTKLIDKTKNEILIKLISSPFDTAFNGCYNTFISILESLDFKYIRSDNRDDFINSLKKMIKIFEQSDKNVAELDNYYHSNIRLCQICSKNPDLKNTDAINQLLKRKYCTECEKKHPLGYFECTKDNCDILTPNSEKNKNTKKYCDFHLKEESEKNMNDLLRSLSNNKKNKNKKNNKTNNNKNKKNNKAKNNHNKKPKAKQKQAKATNQQKKNKQQNKPNSNASKPKKVKKQ